MKIVIVFFTCLEPVGRRLLNILLNWNTPTMEGLHVWHASLLLSYILHCNRAAKDLVLRIQLDPNSDTYNESNLLVVLIRHVIQAIKSEADMLIQVGFLRLISIWLFDCPNAVKTLFQNPSNLPFFMGVIDQHSNPHISGLCSLLAALCGQENELNGLEVLLNNSTNAISVDKFVERLALLTKTEDYVSAEQGKLLMHTADLTKVMLYDYDFTLFFSSFYQRVLSKLKVLSKTAMINLRDINAEDSKYYMEKQRLLEAKIKEQENTINKLQVELMSDSPTAGRIDIIQSLNEQIKEKETTIYALLQRLQASSSSDDIQTKLKEEKDKRKLMKEKTMLLEKEKLELSKQNLQLREELTANSHVSDSNLIMLQSRIQELEGKLEQKEASYNQLSQEHQAKSEIHEQLLAVLGKQTLILQKHGIGDESSEEEESEEEGEETNS